MKRVYLGVVIVALAAVSCSRPAPQPVAPAPAPGEDNTPAAQTATAKTDAMEMKGINLYMHRRVPVDGAPGKPELWVRADSFSIEGDQAYNFEKAHAIIYTRDGEEITMEANHGRFEQDKNAVLEGEVRVTAGTLKMLLSDIRWQRGEEDAAGTAETDNPVVIDDPDLQLNAAGMRLYPDTHVFELTNVSGVVRLGKELL